MSRDTSVEAYRKIKADGLLSQRRLEVYEYLFRYGPKTAGQIIAALKTEKTSDSSFNARTSELRKLGVLREVGKQLGAGKAGTSCILWDVTAQLPTKPKKSGSSQCPRCGQDVPDSGNTVGEQVELDI